MLRYPAIFICLFIYINSYPFPWFVNIIPINLNKKYETDRGYITLIVANQFNVDQGLVPQILFNINYEAKGEIFDPFQSSLPGTVYNY
jgi:hypothetical protein